MIDVIDLDSKQFELYTNVLVDGYSELIAMYIAKNNIKDYKTYLYPSYKKLESPLLMKDAKKAMDYFKENYKDFLLVGDYDTDGVTASAAVYMFVKEKYNYEIPVYIPERKEGYGLNKNIIDYTVKIGKTAIITVDNGIAAHDAVQYGKDKGLFIIITDHHEIQEIGLPNADFIVNPKRKDSLFSDKELSGAAVAWNCLRIIDEKMAEKFLPLILLGTIADVVPLVNQNRIISKLGTNIPVDEIEIYSIRELLKYLKKEVLERGLIEFKISPMINSSGRMENATQAFNFFIETDENKIQEKIAKLEETNEARKIKQAEIEPFVMKQIDRSKKFQLIFPTEDMEFPNSLVGIMAGRVNEEMYQPTIVFYNKIINGEECFGGSGRSPEWFDFRELINELKREKLLVAGGGHKLAIGLTLKKNNLNRFIEIFNSVISRFKSEKKKTEVYKIFNLSDDKDDNQTLIQNTLDDLSYLEPFGNKNPQPDLAFKYQKATYFNKIGEKHLKFNAQGIDVISFNNKYNIKTSGCIIGMPQLNEWYSKNGKKNINYNILLKNYSEN